MHTEPYRSDLDKFRHICKNNCAAAINDRVSLCSSSFSNASLRGNKSATGHWSIMWFCVMTRPGLDAKPVPEPLPSPPLLFSEAWSSTCCTLRMRPFLCFWMSAFEEALSPPLVRGHRTDSSAASDINLRCPLEEAAGSKVVSSKLGAGGGTAT